MSEKAIYFDDPGDGEVGIYETVTRTTPNGTVIDALYSELDKSWTDHTKGKVGLSIKDTGSAIEIDTNRTNVKLVLDYGEAHLLRILLSELKFQTEGDMVGTLLRASDVKKV